MQWPPKGITHVHCPGIDGYLKYISQAKLSSCIVIGSTRGRLTSQLSHTSQLVSTRLTGQSMPLALIYRRSLASRQMKIMELRLRKSDGHLNTPYCDMIHTHTHAYSICVAPHCCTGANALASNCECTVCYNAILVA